MARPKGSTNKKTSLCRAIVEAYLKKTIPERLLELAKSGKAEEHVILMNLMPYCYPKLAPKEMEEDEVDDAVAEVKELAEKLNNVKSIPVPTPTKESA